MADWPLSRHYYFFPRVTPMFHPFFARPRDTLLTSSFFDLDPLDRMQDEAARQMIEVFKDFDTLSARPIQRSARDWMDVDDDEFFKDIEHPFLMESEKTEGEGQKSLKGEAAAAEPEPSPEAKPTEEQQQAQAQAQQGQQQQQQMQQQQQRQQPRSHSSRYVYSSTTIKNEKGEPVTREFKHYEDSTGRAKTWRRRAIGDKAVPEEFQKFPGKEVEKKELTNMKENEIQEFEKQWQETPFVKRAQREEGQQQQQRLEGQKGQGRTPEHEQSKEPVHMEQ